jgi:hypothetical protein
VLATCGVQVLMTDLFALAGTELLGRLQRPPRMRRRSRRCAG